MPFIDSQGQKVLNKLVLLAAFVSVAANSAKGSGAKWVVGNPFWGPLV